MRSTAASDIHCDGGGASAARHAPTSCELVYTSQMVEGHTGKADDQPSSRRACSSCRPHSGQASGDGHAWDVSCPLGKVAHHLRGVINPRRARGCRAGASACPCAQCELSTGKDGLPPSRSDESTEARRYTPGPSGWPSAFLCECPTGRSHRGHYMCMSELLGYCGDSQLSSLAVLLRILDGGRKTWVEQCILFQRDIRYLQKA